MVAVVTTIMEPIVSIITSYHGYSSFCISVLALVSRLSRKIVQKKYFAIAKFEGSSV